MKKLLCLGLSLLMLAGVSVLPVSATSEVLLTDAYDNPVRYSVTDDVMSGWGLAFCFTLNADNVTKNENTHGTRLEGATLTYEGEACAITRIGALVTASKAMGEDENLLVRDGVDTIDSGYYRLQDVAAAKMYKAEAGSCTFAVRVTDIPYEYENRLVYARPYVEILLNGEAVTLYGHTVSTSYGEQLEEDNVLVPYYGTDVDGKGRLSVGDTAIICDTLYLEIQDELDEWMIMTDIDNVSKVFLGFYDADGNQIGTSELHLPDMSSQNASTLFEVELPSGTAQVKIDSADILYWTEWEEVD